MKSRLPFLCVLGVVALLAAAPARAEKPFDESSLMGTYAFTHTLVRAADNQVDLIAYCSGYGTITFYGDGTGEIMGTELCSDSQEGAKEYEQPMTYATDDPPFFVIWDNQTAGFTHCQSLQKGAVIMCDGTQRADGTQSFLAVGMKQ